MTSRQTSASMRQPGVADADDLAGQQRETGRRASRVEVDEQHRQPQPEGQHHPDHRIPFAGPPTENAEQRRRQGAADQRAHAHLEPDQQRESRSRQRQFTGAMDGERHLTHHDERPDQPGHQTQQRRRQQRLLDEVVA